MNLLKKKYKAIIKILINYKHSKEKYNYVVVDKDFLDFINLEDFEKVINDKIISYYKKYLQDNNFKRDFILLKPEDFEKFLNKRKQTMKTIILNNETFEVHKDRNWYVIEHPSQPLVGIGLTLEEALEDLKIDIECCIEEYVEVDEETLTVGSKEFRKFLIEYAKNN